MDVFQQNGQAVRGFSASGAGEVRAKLGDEPAQKATALQTFLQVTEGRLLTTIRRLEETAQRQMDQLHRLEGSPPGAGASDQELAAAKVSRLAPVSAQEAMGNVTSCLDLLDSELARLRQMQEQAFQFA